MNKKEKELIGALIGLAKACNVHLKTGNTDSIIIKSLAAIFPLEENGEELLQRAREEKLAVAPDCATCFAPCGNTDEYNLDELQASGISETVRDLKFQLLNLSHEIASGMVSYTINSTEENISLLYKSLCVVSYDVDEERVQTVLKELQRITI